MYVEMEIVGRSDTGRVRQNNQDCVHVDSDRGLFVLADGVGGGPAGEFASRLAVDTVLGLLEAEIDHRWYRVWGRADQARLRVMKRAVLAAHQALVRKIHEQPELQGMGCTLLAGVLGTGKCLCVSVGDSRVYRSSGEGLHQVTRDQTLANQLIDQGFLGADDPKLEQYNHVLTDAIGGTQEPEVQGHVIALAEHDRLLACSDGLSGMLDDAQIDSILEQPAGLGELVDELVDGANHAGGRDNISVVLAVTRGRGLLPLCG